MFEQTNRQRHPVVSLALSRPLVFQSYQPQASWQMPNFGLPLCCSKSMLPVGKYSERAGIGLSQFSQATSSAEGSKGEEIARGQAATSVQETAKMVPDNDSAVMITVYIRERTRKVVDGSGKREWTLRTKKFIRADLKCGGKDEQRGSTRGGDRANSINISPLWFATRCHSSQFSTSTTRLCSLIIVPRSSGLHPEVKVRNMG